MSYILLFLEGIITFISPCLLPLLPLYISYFAAGQSQDTTAGKRRALVNALGFIAGFSLLFVILGVFAGILGQVLQDYRLIINIVAGLIMILFGLNIMGIISIPLLNATYRKSANVKNLSFFSSLLFGFVFAISWTPCVGPFLTSALLIASVPGSAWQGAFMLFVFAMGLGLPFLLCALLIDKLKTTFDFIKRHYKTVNMISGILLIVLGLLMMTGLLGYLMAVLTF
ncbi:MAG: cytochrome c biogenesis CcdA family protein [Peptococcaceae bacterium]|nr:cytochrome c biogenesis CcdA family protein [Peptococcaceae bacterium]